MLFESERVEAEWESSKLFPMTRRIVEEAQEYVKERWGWEFFLTCIFRTIPEDTQLEGSRIHPAWRAVDVRDKDQPAEAIADLTLYINHRYVYDPKRPRLVCCYSKPHGTGPHVHFQAHPSTRLFVPAPTPPPPRVSPPRSKVAPRGSLPLLVATPEK